MSISDKIKAINNKIEQNKVQYDLDRQLLRFLLYHQEMLVNFDRQIFFYQKRLFEKLSLSKELKTETNWHCKETESKIRQYLWVL